MILLIKIEVDGFGEWTSHPVSLHHSDLAAEAAAAAILCPGNSFELWELQPDGHFVQLTGDAYLKRFPSLQLLVQASYQREHLADFTAEVMARTEHIRNKAALFGLILKRQRSLSELVATYKGPLP